MKYDVAVIGGSLGGVQAARAAAEQGCTVFLCEETDWIGGQLTSQAVPPDEHPWIETSGATQSYRDYREKVRQYYRSLPQTAAHIANADCFCPGSSWVSHLAHEPTVAQALLMESLAPYLQSNRLCLKVHTVCVEAHVSGDTIYHVMVKDLRTGETETVEAKYFLDATDCGDLLPLVGAEHRTGAESKNETGELHAPLRADAEDMQPVTWVAALELNPKDKAYIKKPEKYEYFSSLVMPYDDNKLLSWYGPNAKTGKKEQFCMFDNDLPQHPLGLWSYRRIIDPSHYTVEQREVTLLNWPQNDYSFGNLYDTADAAYHREMARELTLCAVYWLQNDAPRADGGKGYNVKLCPDITGTQDGLAMAPYIRESRRIIAKNTIREQDISRAGQKELPHVPDSVGVGHYAVDIHLTTKSHTFFYEPTWPFEIPLSAMIPVRMQNLIPACKNIGCTHLTNGCYRLHPVEWNIGEVAGHLAAYCISHQCSPNEVAENSVADFQSILETNGVQLHWNKTLVEGLTS